MFYSYYLPFCGNNLQNKSTQRAQTSAKGAQFLDYHQIAPENYLAITSFKERPDPDDPDSDPDHSQNLISCSLSHLGQILNISSKPINNFLNYQSLKITFHGYRRFYQNLSKFLSYLVHKQTNRQTDRQTQVKT